MSQTRTSPDAAAVLRSLQLGDRWTYQVSGELTRPGNTAALALSGTIVVTVVPDSLTLRPDCLMLTFVQALQAERGDGSIETLPAPDLAFAFAQDPATQDTLIVADNMGRNGECRQAKSPQVFYPGHWTVGTGYDNKLDFGMGDFVRNSLLVTGQALVETPLGVFPSWVSKITSESPMLGNITGLDWWAPDLGAPACFETNATMPDGSATRIHAALSATNVIGGHDKA